MNRNNFRQRPTTPSASFVREPDEKGELNSVPFPGERAHVSRKLFIVKRTSRLTETNGPVRTVRHILVFDDHPDSLRLILGPSASPQPFPGSGGRDILWDFILPGITILAGVIAMLWLLL
jgi:hypothetical protein